MTLQLEEIQGIIYYTLYLPSQKRQNKNDKSEAGGVAQAGERLLSKCKALSSNTSTIKEGGGAEKYKGRKEKKERERKEGRKDKSGCKPVIPDRDQEDHSLRPAWIKS
jgi:hypothetical protein